MRRFSMVNHVVMITGAAGALGQHFAQIMVEAGARVVLAARNYDVVDTQAKKLGHLALPVALDVTEPDSIDQTLDHIESQFGLCDVLINNAGVAVTASAQSMTLADWDNVIEVNLRGSFVVAQAVAKRLIKAGSSGSIVNTASILGDRVIPGVVSYAVSKAGLLHLTRTLAVEWARYKIRVNALSPGYIATKLNSSFFDTAAGQEMIRRIPQRRLCVLDDLTGPILLLASEAGSHMTGTTITVDGGHSIAGL